MTTLSPSLTRRQVLLGAVYSTVALTLTTRPVSAGGWQFFPTQPPVLLPPLGFLDEQRQKKTLADFRGRFVLLTLWATWCAPCVVEMPLLNGLQKDLGAAVEIVPLAVRSGDAVRVRKFYAEEKIDTLPLYTDAPGVSLYGLGEHGIPVSVVIDPEGRDVGRFRGAVNWSGKEARSFLRHALEAGGGNWPAVPAVSGSAGV